MQETKEIGVHIIKKEELDSLYKKKQEDEKNKDAQDKET